jgi:hypothetical protein
LLLRAIAAQAGLDETLPGLADNLLIDRLLQAVDPCLRHAELHLVALVLSLQALRRRKTRDALGRGDGHRAG